MNSQSAQKSALDSTFTNQLHFAAETCPTCGQDIPPDKLAEIKGRIAVKERERTLTITAQLEKAYATKEVQRKAEAKAALELERKQGAAREARIREEAKKAADNLVKEKLAGSEKARLQAEQRALEFEQNLKTQREAMEQAKEDAVNEVKARAFQENQRLSTQVNNLQRALDQQTNEELGEGAEVKIFEALKAEFKTDRIERIPRGSAGADIRHVVMLRGQECGTILYDSKNHKQWREEHADKLRRDQLAAKAEHAILSTHKFPRNARQLDQREGVILANPARVVSVATIIRQHLLQLHTLRVSKVEREKKTGALYEFIVSAPCKQLLDRIDQRTDGLLDLQADEIRWHEKNWKHQGTAIRAIQKAKADLGSEIDSIIGTRADDADMSEAS